MHQIGIAAKRSGVHIETIRYYERKGIIPHPRRSAMGRRLYTNQDISRLCFIKGCRTLGFSLSDISELVHLPAGGNASCAGLKKLSERHHGRVKEKIRHLENLATMLERLIEKCEANQLNTSTLHRFLEECLSDPIDDGGDVG